MFFNEEDNDFPLNNKSSNEWFKSKIAKINDENILTKEKDNNLDMLNSEQKACVDILEGPALVLSGAGTGKTRVIVNRFLALVNSGIESQSILCLTFSNKAANEISKRIALKNIETSGLWIGTFHSICLRILQITNSVNKNNIIIDESDSKKIAEELGITEFLLIIQKYKDDNDIALSKEAQDAYDKYETFLEKNNYLDFGSIIMKTLDILRNNPQIKSFVQRKFQHIMVDEFQDTSVTQNALIMEMINEKKNIFCVGDDDQCIYEWRGANIENILKFKDYFPDAKIRKLERNYRSSNKIVKVASHLISKNKKRMEKTIWTEEAGENVTIAYAFWEPDFIAQTIKKVSGNVGILVRSTSIIPMIEAALVKEGISYKIFGGYKFFDRKEVKICMYYIRAVFLKDLLALEKIINFPKRGIGPRKFEKIKEMIAVDNNADWAEIFQNVGLGDLSIFFKKCQSLIVSNVGEIVQFIIRELDLISIFETGSMENIEKLIVMSSRFPKIEDFMSNFFAEDVEDEANVSIMTVHASKGLEFQNVFVPSMVEGGFPHFRSIEEGNIESERRLAYVAFTRARKKLFLTYSLENKNFKQNFGPSRFLIDLPKNCLQYQFWK